MSQTERYRPTPQCETHRGPHTATEAQLIPPPELSTTSVGITCVSLFGVWQRHPRPIETSRCIVWAIVTAAVAYGALVFLALMGTTIPDPCDDIHESPYTALNIGVLSGSILASLAAGHRLLARRWRLVPYAAGALQGLIWHWLLAVPKGTC